MMKGCAFESPVQADITVHWWHSNRSWFVLQAKAQQAVPSVSRARKSAAKGIAAKGQQAKSAAKQASGAASSNDATSKKKGGFLQALGFGQGSVYADDEN